MANTNSQTPTPSISMFLLLSINTDTGGEWGNQGYCRFTKLATNFVTDCSFEY